MKTISPVSSLTSLLLVGLCVGGCQPQLAPTPLAQERPQQKKTKTVRVSITTATRPGFHHEGETSFTVGLAAKPDTAVHWDGQRFAVKTDSGDSFWEFSPNLAFQKKQTVAFNIEKKVTIAGANDSQAVSTSETVSVKRGVPATF